MCNWASPCCVLLLFWVCSLLWFCCWPVCCWGLLGSTLAMWFFCCVAAAACCWAAAVFVLCRCFVMRLCYGFSAAGFDLVLISLLPFLRFVVLLLGMGLLGLLYVSSSLLFADVFPLLVCWCSYVIQRGQPRGLCFSGLVLDGLYGSFWFCVMLGWSWMSFLGPLLLATICAWVG